MSTHQLTFGSVVVLSRVDGPLSFCFTVDSTQISLQDILPKFQAWNVVVRFQEREV